MLPLKLIGFLAICLLLGTIKTINAACNPSCANGGTCSSNTCSCKPGWTGTSCSQSMCSSACVNGGTCIGLDTCACVSGWTGVTCSQAICSPSCAHGGTCTAPPDTCACPNGWTDTSCNQAICTSNCENGGTCTAPDTCTCAPGWTGATCDQPICTTACANGGTCVGPNTCACNSGWSPASFCTTGATCTPDCATNAFCAGTNNCDCLWGYSSDNCSTPPYPLPSPDNYIAAFSFIKGGGISHLDAYLLLGDSAIQASTGALRLVNNVAGRSGSIWGQLPATMSDFTINATVEFGRSSSSGGDGIGFFLGWNYATTATYSAGWEYGVSWSNQSGLAVIFTPRYHKICAMAAQYSTTFQKNCNGSAPSNNTFSYDTGTALALRQKLRIGIVVKSAKTVTVEGCTISGCTTYINQKTFTLSSFNVDTLYFGVGAQSSTGATDYVDLHELKVYTQHTCSTPCKNGGYCTATNVCRCPPGFTSFDCAQGICNPPCASTGWCVAPGVCQCVGGWFGTLCNQVAYCNPPCPLNAQCTANNTCTCLTGWSGAGCNTPTQWIFTPGTELPAYSLSPYNSSNYDMYLCCGTPYPQSGTGYATLVNSANRLGSVWSRRPITGLPNFSVNVTMQLGNTANTGKGFTIDIASGGNLRRPTNALNIWPPNLSYQTSLTIRVNPASNWWCVQYSSTPTNFDLDCNNGYINPRYQIIGNGNPHLRQKISLGLTFENYAFKSLYTCNVSSCLTIFNNFPSTASSNNISKLLGQTFLGVTAWGDYTWEYTDLLDIKVYPRNVCNVSCVYGYCNAPANSSTVNCICSAGYTGSACDIPMCNPMCGNAGTCTAGTCVCAPGWIGPTCEQLATCATACTSNAYCTAINTCTCLYGRSTAPACLTNTLLPGNATLLPYYSLTNGATSNYDISAICCGGFSNPQSGSRAIRLVNSMNQVSSIWAKVPISLLSSYRAYATVTIGNKDLNGEGFTIEITTLPSVGRSAVGNPPGSWTAPSGLMLRVAPVRNSICLYFSQASASVDTACSSPLKYYTVPGNPRLRTKMSIDLLVLNNVLTNVTWCNTASCITVMNNISIDLSVIKSPTYFEITGYSNYNDNYEMVEVNDIAIYKIENCGVSCVYGTCNGSSSGCVCYPGFTGAACDTIMCNPYCLNGGTCLANNTCLCSAGWYGSSCASVASCNPLCPTNAQCTGSNVCACITGWSGADCTTPTQWIFDPIYEMQDFTLANGDTINYNLYIIGGISNPQSNNAIRLVNGGNQMSSIWSTWPISGLRNYNVNVTIQVGNTDSIGDGFTIEFATANSIRRQANPSGWISSSYGGLMIRVTPNYNAICILYHKTGADFRTNMNCQNIATRFDIAGNPQLRQKMQLGLLVENGIFKSVYMCTVSSCSMVFTNLNYDILGLGFPAYLGVSGMAGLTFDTVDVVEIKVFERRICPFSCIYGTCNTVLNVCVCANSYTGPSCNMSSCEAFPCQNGGYCIGANKCQCQSGYTGNDCSTAMCSQPCQHGGTCIVPWSGCACAPGWQNGGWCQSAAYCWWGSPYTCALNSYCVSNWNCQCLTGWTGSNCATPTFSVGTPLAPYSLTNGNTDNYVLYIWNTITNPQPFTNAPIRLINGPNQTSSIWSKYPITGLPNFSINVTIENLNTGTLGDGYAIELATSSSIQRPAAKSNLAAWTSTTYSGIRLRVAPNANAICITYSYIPTNTLNSLSCTLPWPKYTISGEAYLRQKIALSAVVENNIFSTVYMCSVINCRVIFKDLNYNISKMPGELHLGISGYSRSTYDTIDVFDVKVYPRQSKTCNVNCIYGDCKLASPNVCQCSFGYKGAACDTPICNCLNGGTCLSPFWCKCPSGFSGVDCSMANVPAYKSAKEYKLIDANVLNTSAHVNKSEDCAKLCKATSKCKSANYRINDSMCELLDMDASATYVLNTTLTCDTNYIHWEIDYTLTLGYFPSREMSIKMQTEPCPNLYDTLNVSCVNDRWVASCQSQVYGSCLEAMNQTQAKSGVYSVNPDNGSPFNVYCNMESDPVTGNTAGYTTILRRKDGSVNFNVNFQQMRSFFGDLNGEFWIGADNLNRLTGSTPRELVMILWPFEPDNRVVYARWTTFSIGNAASNYTLTATGYSSPYIGVDMLRAMNGRSLRTYDNDIAACISRIKGPAWTDNNPCLFTNPFGRYLYGYHTVLDTGIDATDYMGHYYSYRALEWRMK